MDQFLTRLTIYLNERDRWAGEPLYHALIQLAKTNGLSGATAIRAIAGYGESKKIYSYRWLELLHSLPIMVQIIDTEEQIQHFLPQVTKMVSNGLITLEKVQQIGAPKQTEDMNKDGTKAKLE